MVDGNYPYLEQTEKAIANFHGYEAGVMLGSGFDANVAIWTAIPRPGDVMLYDEASHASTLDGMKQSLTKHRVEFQHNDLESFRTTLSSIFASHPLVRQGKRTVIVSVEATYSMDGDICPLREMIDIANEISRNRGNVQFVVDEAYGTGTIGPEGKGFVCELGLEKEVAVVMHSFAKGLGCHGGKLNLSLFSLPHLNSVPRRMNFQLTQRHSSYRGWKCHNQEYHCQLCQVIPIHHGASICARCHDQGRI
jgi:8-amino-7-oxononanoate synthase